MDLPAPLSPDERGDLAGPYREVHVVQHLDGAEALVHPAQLQDRFGHGHPPVHAECAAVLEHRPRTRDGVDGLLDAERSAGGCRAATQTSLAFTWRLVDHGLDVVLGDQLRGEQHRLDRPVALGSFSVSVASASAAALSPLASAAASLAVASASCLIGL